MSVQLLLTPITFVKCHVQHKRNSVSVTVLTLSITTIAATPVIRTLEKVRQIPMIPLIILAMVMGYFSS